MIEQYGYYLPIYFQAVKEATATESGTRYLALVIPQMFGVVFSGALVTAFGSYVSFLSRLSPPHDRQIDPSLTGPFHDHWKCSWDHRIRVVSDA